MNKEIFIKELAKLNINVTDDILQLLDKYYQFLNEYNSHTNLTAIIAEEDVYLKHFYDSLTITKAVNPNQSTTLIDIGTGAGFPGVILKIFYPHLKVTLLDSNNKKTKFLTELIQLLELKDVNIVNERAEEYATKHLNEYDICTSRAVAFVDIISELSLPLIKENGVSILMKGNITNEEKILIEHSGELGISKYEMINFKLPITEDERNLIILKKAKSSVKSPNYAKLIKRNKIWNSQ